MEIQISKVSKGNSTLNVEWSDGEKKVILILCG